jgi:hypothetical protein
MAAGSRGKGVGARCQREEHCRRRGDVLMAVDSNEGEMLTRGAPAKAGDVLRAVDGSKGEVPTRGALAKAGRRSEGEVSTRGVLAKAGRRSDGC